MITLAIGKFDNKKGIFFIFYRQTSNFKMKTTNQKVSGDKVTGDKVTGDKVTEGTT
jgi:hypothetical protein